MAASAPTPRLLPQYAYSMAEEACIENTEAIKKALEALYKTTRMEGVRGVLKTMAEEKDNAALKKITKKRAAFLDEIRQVATKFPSKTPSRAQSP